MLYKRLSFHLHQHWKKFNRILLLLLEDQLKDILLLQLQLAKPKIGMMMELVNFYFLTKFSILLLKIYQLIYFLTLSNVLDNVIGKKKLAQNILITSPKPSFLLWDKVYSKLNTYEEGFWLIRALEGVLLDKDGALLKNNDAQ